MFLSGPCHSAFTANLEKKKIGSLVSLCYVCVVLFAFQMARADYSTQDAVLIRQEHRCPTEVFFSCCLFCVLFFVLSFCVCCVLLPFLWISLCLDSYMDCVKVHTRSLLQPS